MVDRKVVELGAAVLLSLIPAVILYMVFQEENVAEFVKGSEGIKLGGPAALFFIVFVTSLRYLRRKIDDKLASLKQELAGKWKVTALSSGQHSATSNCEITVHDGEIALSGGQYMDDATPVGTWSVDCLFLSSNRFAYLYDLKETGGTQKSWKGLVDMNLSRNNGKIALKGSWESIGPEYKSGTISYVKSQGGK